MEQVDTELQKLAAPVRRLYEQSTKEIEELEVKLDSARARRKRVERALRELDPEAVKTKPRKKQSGKPQTVPSDRVLKLVTEAIMDGAETLVDIREATGLSASSVHYAIRYLRDEEVIRKAGTVPVTNAAIYKPMNPVPAEEAKVNA